MNPNEIVTKVAAALTHCNIPYMIVGSFSSNVYGVERGTQDADIVMQLESHSIGEIISALGPEFHVDPQLGFETVTMTMRYIVSHVDPFFKIELFLLTDDEHDQERFRRKVIGHIAGVSVPYPTPEDVVITKLRWSKGGKRQKDVDDVRNVLAVQQGNLDMPYIRQWCTRHDTLEILEKTLRSIPPLPPATPLG